MFNIVSLENSNNLVRGISDGETDIALTHLDWNGNIHVVVKSEEEASILMGDVTGDGKVAMGDVVKLARAVAWNLNFTEKERSAADVTGDGKVAMGDVVKLARFVAGDLESLE